MLSWLFSGNHRLSKEESENQDEAWELVGPTYASGLKSTNLKAVVQSEQDQADLRKKILEQHLLQQQEEKDEAGEEPEEDEDEVNEDDFTDAMRRMIKSKAKKNELLNSLGDNEKPFAKKAYISLKTRRRLKKEQAAKKSM
ncbi:UNVERIFIED_CONTAM: hypothetical protein HDU68_000677 [Siphonaria sp. JEL0065]|nr:hypothetical protein HDU68_000677 [Siphonaria sp. JEL0065]